jgi:hypothetical protein
MPARRNRGCQWVRMARADRRTPIMVSSAPIRSRRRIRLIRVGRVRVRPPDIPAAMARALNTTGIRRRGRSLMAASRAGVNVARCTRASPSHHRRSGDYVNRSEPRTQGPRPRSPADRASHICRCAAPASGITRYRYAEPPEGRRPDQSISAAKRRFLSKPDRNLERHQRAVWLRPGARRPCAGCRHRAYGVTDRQHWFEATGTHLSDG